MIDYVKGHPWLVGGVVGVVLLFLILRSHGGAAAPAVPTSDGASDPLAAAQLQTQGAIAGAQIAADAQAAHDQSALEAFRINADTVNIGQQLAAGVRMTEIGASKDVAMRGADVTAQGNSLSASVAIAGLNQQQNIEQIRSSEKIQTTQALTGALIQQAQISAGVSQHYIDAQSRVQSQTVAASEHVETQSWWDRIFG